MPVLDRAVGEDRQLHRGEVDATPDLRVRSACLGLARLVLKRIPIMPAVFGHNCETAVPAAYLEPRKITAFPAVTESAVDLGDTAIRLGAIGQDARQLGLRDRRGRGLRRPGATLGALRTCGFAIPMTPPREPVRQQGRDEIA